MHNLIPHRSKANAYGTCDTGYIPSSGFGVWGLGFTVDTLLLLCMHTRGVCEITRQVTRGHEASHALPTISSRFFFQAFKSSARVFPLRALCTVLMRPHTTRSSGCFTVCRSGHVSFLCRRTRLRMAAPFRLALSRHPPRLPLTAAAPTSLPAPLPCWHERTWRHLARCRHKK